MPPIPQQLYEQLQRKYEIPYLRVKNIVGWMGFQPVITGGGSTPTPGEELSLTTLTIQQLYDLSIDQLSQIGV